MSLFRIVITGGPCAGKSTGMAVIEQKLHNLGYQVIILDEMATNVIKSGITPPMIGNEKFQKILAELQVNRDKSYKAILDSLGEKVILLFDRGILDGEAYCSPEEFNRILKSLNTSRQEVLGMYDGVFHLVTAADGAREFYTTANNSARMETADEAVLADRRTLDCWVGHPHLRVINNKDVDFDGKMTNLLKEITSLIGEPEPMEIERKLLIKKPDISKLEKLYKLNKSEIIQTYLNSPDGIERRVRQRGIDGDYNYYYTEKSDVSFGTRKEIERIISEREYVTLLMEADTTKRQIRKTRYCFVYEDRYFELDIYPFWEDKAILEIEVNDINEKFNIPEEIEIIQDVTGDNQYSNSNLANR